MEAIIGKYRVRMEEAGLILTHTTKVSFDLTLDEVRGLMEFIRVYEGAIAVAQHDTEPIGGIVVDEQSRSDTGRTHA